MSGPIGWDPQYRALILSRGTDFLHTITPRTTSFPAGGAAWIVIRDSTNSTVLDTWNGTYSTTSVSWTVQAATADAIPENARYQLIIQYPTAPTTEMEWAYGPVVRKQ